MRRWYPRATFVQNGLSGTGDANFSETSDSSTRGTSDSSTRETSESDTNEIGSSGTIDGVPNINKKLEVKVDINDITSIVACFENESLKREHFVPYLNVKHMPLDFDVLSTLHLLNDDELAECYRRLTAACETVGKYLIYTRQPNYELKCCNTTVKLPKTMGSWRHLQQQHEHIEEALARRAEANLNSIDNVKVSNNLKTASAVALKDYCSKINECIDRYDGLVRELLYPHKSDSAACVQFAGPKKLYCLVCNFNIPHTDNCYTSHIFNVRHKRRLQYLLKLMHLLAYHDCWSRLPPQYQAHQVHFGCEGFGTHSSSYCRICKLVVQFKDVQLHLESEQHRLLFEREESKNGDDDLHLLKLRLSLYEKPSDSSSFEFKLNYDSSVQNALYISGANGVDSIGLASFQCRGSDGYYCLLCNMPTTVTLLQLHVSGAKHKLLACESQKLEALIAYHQHWMNQSSVFQIHQLHFTPHSRLQTMCRRCSRVIDFEDVEAHLFTSSHHSAMVQFVASKAVGWPFRKKMLNIYAVEAGSSAEPQNGIVEYSSMASPPATIATPRNDIVECSSNIVVAPQQFTSKSKTNIELDQEITNLIYPKEVVEEMAQIDGLGVPVQCKSPTLYFCLLCWVSFSAKLCQQHLGGARHLTFSERSRSRVDAFKTYRLYFSSQKPMIKAHQIFFKPLELQCIQCIPCQKVLKVSNQVLGHISSNEHYGKLIEFIKTAASSWHLIDFCLSFYEAREVEQPKVVALLDYNSTVKDLMYPKIFESFNIPKQNLVMYTVQVRGPHLIYCLLCNCKMLDDKIVMSHCSGRKHMNNMKHKDLKSKLYTYHKFWMHQPLEYQVHQVFFSINNQCSLCPHENFVSYNNVTDHLQSDFHINTLFDPIKPLHDNYHLSTMWSNLYCDEEEYKFNFFIGYDDKVQEVIYSQKAIAEVIKTDNLGVPTVQCLSCSSACCLICQINFNGFNDVLEHSRKIKHQANLQNVEKITALHAYHDYWKNQEEPFQVHHIYFSPINSELCYCRICGQPFSYRHVAEHLLSEVHRNNLARFTGQVRFHLWKKQINLYGAAFIEYLGNRVVSQMEADFALLWPTATAKAPNCELKENGVCELEGVVEKCEETSASSSSESVVALESQEWETVVAPTSSANFDSEFTLKGTYDSLVKKTFYPADVVVPIMKLDQLQIYTIQCVGPNKTRCLLCQETIRVSPASHITQAIHKRRRTQLLELKYVSDYHEFWTNQSFKVQVHHSHFVPWGIGYLYCKLCECDLPYHRLNDHLKYYKHVEVMMRLRDKAASKFHLLDEQFRVYLEGANEQEDEEETIENDVEEEGKAKRRELPNRSTSTDSDSQKQAAKQEPESHSIVKSVLNPNGTLLTDILEHRFHSHMSFMQQIGELVTCEPCSVSMSLNSAVVREHLLLPSHMKKCNFRRKFVYECMVCLKKYSTESYWQEHIQDLEHQRCCNILSESRQKNLTEYHCINCNKVLFGDDLFLLQHNMSRGKRQIKPLQLSAQVKLLFKTSQFITHHCMKLVQEANSVIANQANEHLCCSALERCFSELFPDCKAYPFGSRVSGLGKQDSDLDVFIDVGGMYDGNINQDRDAQESFVRECKRLLQRRRKEFSYINDIPMARTPIIQVFHILSSLDCDLSFRHGLSVENTKFLRLCIQVQPIMQHTVLILKDWLKKIKLNESISTYALCMMVIFYFQTEGLLLPVSELKRLIPQHFVIDGWSIMNCEGQDERIKGLVKQYLGSIKDLLQNFLNFYLKFDYKTQIVCPLLGKPLEKRLFIIEANGTALPSELLEPYISKIRNSTNPEYFRAMSPMCIQDPFDLSHNLTKACTDTLVARFKELCNLTYKHLLAVK